MITFQNITKKIKENTILDNINLVIQGQEFVCLVGPSGAGKTTLLHLLIGADKPDSGEIFIDTLNVSTLKDQELQALRQKIGLVSQDNSLLPNKTAEENIAFALQVCGYSDQEIQRRTKAVLEIIGITKCATKFPHELSGGERQKVAIARALTTEPHLFIADEPTGNLDPDSAAEIIELLKKIHKNGSTVILATHNKSIVDNLQKRVIRLENGKLISDQVGGY